MDILVGAKTINTVNSTVYSALVLIVFKVVELRGVEPRSKRETHMLSTCLVYLWFSRTGQRKTTNPDLSLLYFATEPGPFNGYPCFACAPYATANQEETVAEHLVLSL